MRIGVDIRGLLTGKKSGVEQYTLKLLEYLLKLDQKNTYVLFYVSYRDLNKKMEDFLSEAPFLKQSNVEIKTLKWINLPLLLHALWKPLDWPKVDKICGGLDLMWLPSPRLLPISKNCRKIITFHDLVFELFPQFYDFKSKLWQWQMSYSYLARWADKLIAISKSTKNDLVDLYKIDERKIEVIYEGVDNEYFNTPNEITIEEVRKKFNIKSDFIYYVGSLEPRKNIQTIMRALASLQSDQIKLVISGGKSWLTDHIHKEIEELKLQDAIIFTGFVTEQEKIALLNQARVFMFPSLYEGFGLPVLEAMAAGCPVITSKISSLPEVTESAAILINPNDQDEINKALRDIINNDGLAKNLITKGKLQAKKFNWEKAAQQTLKLFVDGGE